MAKYNGYCIKIVEVDCKITPERCQKLPFLISIGNVDFLLLNTIEFQSFRKLVMSKHIYGVLVQRDRAYRYRLQMARNVNSEVQPQHNYQITNPCVLNNVITNQLLSIQLPTGSKNNNG